MQIPRPLLAAVLSTPPTLDAYTHTMHAYMHFAAHNAEGRWLLASQLVLFFVVVGVFCVHVTQNKLL